MSYILSKLNTVSSRSFSSSNLVPYDFSLNEYPNWNQHSFLSCSTESKWTLAPNKVLSILLKINKWSANIFSKVTCRTRTYIALSGAAGWLPAHSCNKNGTTRHEQKDQVEQMNTPGRGLGNVYPWEQRQLAGGRFGEQLYIQIWDHMQRGGGGGYR